jgi:hypothetical protein
MKKNVTIGILIIECRWCFFLFTLILLVTLCIGWRVWKAANENLAWVIKKE